MIFFKRGKFVIKIFFYKKGCFVVRSFIKKFTKRGKIIWI